MNNQYNSHQERRDYGLNSNLSDSSDENNPNLINTLSLYDFSSIDPIEGKMASSNRKQTAFMEAGPHFSSQSSPSKQDLDDLLNFPLRKVNEPEIFENYARGCIIGAFCGDAIGAYIEWKKNIISEEDIKKALTLPGGGTFGLDSGQVTGGSELALSLGHALVKGKGNLDINMIANLYATWIRSSPFDVGMTISNALFKFREKKGKVKASEVRKEAHKSVKLQGNGALMRVTPLAVWCSKLKNKDDLIRAASEEAKLTHPNEAVQHVNAAYIYTIQHLLNNPGDHAGAYRKCKEVLEYLGSEIVLSWLDQVDRGENELPHGDKEMEHVKTAFCYALYNLKQNHSFEEAIKFTLRRGGDTCTNCCVVGGLIGALCGLDQIPYYIVKKMMDCNPSRKSRDAFLVPTKCLEKVISEIIRFAPKKLKLIGKERKNEKDKWNEKDLISLQKHIKDQEKPFMQKYKKGKKTEFEAGLTMSMTESRRLGELQPPEHLYDQVEMIYTCFNGSFNAAKKGEFLDKLVISRRIYYSRIRNSKIKNASEISQPNNMEVEQSSKPVRSPLRKKNRSLTAKYLKIDKMNSKKFSVGQWFKQWFLPEVDSTLKSLRICIKAGQKGRPLQFQSRINKLLNSWTTVSDLSVQATRRIMQTDSDSCIYSAIYNCYLVKSGLLAIHWQYIKNFVICCSKRPQVHGIANIFPQRSGKVPKQASKWRNCAKIVLRALKKVFDSYYNTKHCPYESCREVFSGLSACERAVFKDFISKCKECTSFDQLESFLAETQNKFLINTLRAFISEFLGPNNKDFEKLLNSKKQVSKETRELLQQNKKDLLKKFLDHFPKEKIGVTLIN